MFTPSSSLINGIIDIIFYVMFAIFILGSTTAIYSLISYGKSKAVVVGVSMTYAAFAVVLFLIAQVQLNQINF